MIGRVEVTEILGMAATCAALLFAGFAVETLEGEVEPAWALSGADIEAPELPPSLALPEELALQTPVLEQPLHLLLGQKALFHVTLLFRFFRGRSLRGLLAVLGRSLLLLFAALLVDHYFLLQLSI